MLKPRPKYLISTPAPCWDGESGIGRCTLSVSWISPEFQKILFYIFTSFTSCPNITIITSLVTIFAITTIIPTSVVAPFFQSFTISSSSRPFFNCWEKSPSKESSQNAWDHNVNNIMRKNHEKSCYHVIKHTKVIIKRICTERLQWDHDHHQLFNVSNPIKRLEFQSLSDISREFSLPRQSPHTN